MPFIPFLSFPTPIGNLIFSIHSRLEAAPTDLKNEILKQSLKQVQDMVQDRRSPAKTELASHFGPRHEFHENVSREENLA